MRYMLDTNICIYLIKHHPPEVRERFAAHALSDICISSITLAELMFGAAKGARAEQSRAALLQFAAPLEIAAFDDRAAECYGELRADLRARGEPIGPMDMLIAAHAKSRGLTLVTNNLRDFARVQGLRSENWLEA